MQASTQRYHANITEFRVGNVRRSHRYAIQMRYVSLNAINAKTIKPAIKLAGLSSLQYTGSTYRPRLRGTIIKNTPMGFKNARD